jgi:hypothetical protein
MAAWHSGHRIRFSNRRPGLETRQGSIPTSTFGLPSAVGPRPSGYFEFKHTNIMLTAVTKRPFSDGPKYQHLQFVTAVSNGCQ